MIKIYCIEDINDIKYIGSTKQELYRRFADHKKRNECSSRELNLYNAIIYTLEECSEEDRIEREQYYIDTIDCVNKNNTIHKKKEYNREYMRNFREKNRDKVREYNREYQKKYYQQNKDKYKVINKKRYEKNKFKNKI